MSISHPSEEPKDPKVEAALSKDGSSTLWAPEFDEHYHSIHGALTESLHVFIEAGLKAHKGGELRIFEMGFGTGLNALLTQYHRSQRAIHYLSLEKYPVNEELWKGLNYADQLSADDANSFFEQLHQAPWGEAIEISEGFVLEKVEGDLLNFDSGLGFDLIYFDAFAPTSQAYLWTEEVMKKIYRWCNPGAIFTTYSAKGDVRRALMAVGFEVEKIPGPPGKREMLRARKMTS